LLSLITYLPTVIHVILTPEAGVSDIPLLLEGKTPPSSDPGDLGTRDYSQRAAAVVTGGGYDDAAFQIMRDACKGKSNIPWLRPDLSVPTPPLGPLYGKAMVERVKACLDNLAEEGKLGEDSIRFF
jgi:hypothetical protein